MIITAKKIYYIVIILMIASTCHLQSASKRENEAFSKTKGPSCIRMIAMGAITLFSMVSADSSYHKKNEWTGAAPNWAGQAWDYCTSIYSAHELSYSQPLAPWRDLHECIDEKAFVLHKEASIKEGKEGIIARYHLAKDYKKRGDKDRYLQLLIGSAECGYDEAQYDLGYLFFVGEDLSREPEKAFKLFKTAANQGDSEAIIFLTARYLSDEATTFVSLDEVIEWISKFTRGDKSEALYFIAGMYEEGRSIPVNIEKALTFYALALESGCIKAKKKIESMRREKPRILLEDII